MINLPVEFTEKMQNILGGEFEDFLKSYDSPRNFGLRVNTSKISPEEFERISPFHLSRIPWVENGYYYEEEDAPARHPFYYAGLYYLQEPSAMTPASRLPVEPGDKVLDLCAAPGGKATELGSRLLGKGLLVANDISASRAKALLKNMEVFGISNSFLTNEVPNRLEERFTEYFDKILVDAPCSGEGMFRKDPAVAKVWDKEKPLLCAKQQKEIILRAAGMLKPGGKLLYSTCTFSPEENEEVICFLMEQCPQFQLLEIPGYEGFSKGLYGLDKCVRIWPHRMNGEGHFMALLQKGEKDLGGTGEALNTEVPFSKTETRGSRRKSGKGDFLKTGKTKEEKTVLDAFLEEVQFVAEEKVTEVRKGQAYLVPEATVGQKGLNFLRNGLYLGEVKKDRFEPSQSFAMALKREQYPSSVNFHCSDSRVGKYLRGETVFVDDMQIRRQKGWQLICIEGYPLGWGKLTGGILKNKYHPGWRMK